MGDPTEAIRSKYKAGEYDRPPAHWDECYLTHWACTVRELLERIDELEYALRFGEDD